MHIRVKGSPEMIFLRFALHLSPFFPLVAGRIYLALALALLVAIFYIKTFKLEQALSDLPDGGSDEFRELESLKNRWKSMTFLKGS